MDEKRMTIKIDRMLEALVPSYISDIMKWTETMARAAEQADFESVRKKSHQMTGSGGGYGFDFITETGRKINRAAHDRNVSAIKEQCLILYDYLKNVDVEYVDMDDGLFG